MSEMKEFMTLEEVADLLGVNYQLIYKLVRTGEMTSVRIGRVYRITKADFEAYIEKSRTRTMGGICSACGTSYASDLSLKHECTECGEPICVDCWMRKKVRVCKQHGTEGGSKSEPPPGEAQIPPADGQA